MLTRRDTTFSYAVTLPAIVGTEQYATTTPYPEEPVSFKAIEHECTLLHAQIYYLDVTSGTEGFFNDIKRLFLGIFNIIIHTLNTFKTNIFKSYKSLKRTELRYYHESNRLSVSSILNYDYGLLSGAHVPVPSDMTATYFTSATSIFSCLKILNMKERSRSFVEIVKQTRDNCLRRTTTNTAAVTNSSDLPVVIKAFNAENHCFSKYKRRMDAPFSEVFPAATDFKETDDLLFTNEDYQYSVAGIHSDLETCSATMDEILAHIKNDSGILTKRDLLNLSDMCGFMAKLYDIFGVVILDNTKVEHNFVEVLASVRKTFEI